jgi:hypothetical protein
MRTANRRLRLRLHHPDGIFDNVLPAAGGVASMPGPKARYAGSRVPWRCHRHRAGARAAAWN